MPVVAVLKISNLPGNALDASHNFVVEHLPLIRDRLSDGGDLVVVLPPAPYDHSDWRRAAVRDLARHFAPVRVNFIAGSTEPQIDAAVGYLSSAKGVTGQYLPLHND